MKERTPEQLKGQIRSFAGKRNLQPQEVLQMFFMERFLERLSKSQYRNNFILKGGMLISSMIGIAERTTMDIDTTVSGIDMEEKEIEKVIREVLLIDINDGMEFEFNRLEPIREEDDYNNFRVYFVVRYGKIANKMKIDITAGDKITLGAVEYSYKTILYNLHKESIDSEVLKLAVYMTAKKRQSFQTMSEWKEIIEEMKEDMALKELWRNYCENNTYADGVGYDDVMEVVLQISKMLGF